MKTGTKNTKATKTKVSIVEAEMINCANCNRKFESTGATLCIPCSQA